MKTQVELHIVGDGECMQELRLLANSKVCGSARAIFHGALDREGVLEHYRNCDALILPSLYEAQPLVLLEAMASGVPIIASRLPEIEDLLAGCAILINPDRAGIEAGIDQFVAFPERQILWLTKEGASRMAKYKWGKLINEYTSSYEGIAGCDS